MTLFSPSMWFASFTILLFQLTHALGGLPDRSQLVMVISVQGPSTGTPSLSPMDYPPGEEKYFCGLLGCGALTTAGRAQSVALGRFLAQNYGTAADGCIPNGGNNVSFYATGKLEMHSQQDILSLSTSSGILFGLLEPLMAQRYCTSSSDCGPLDLAFPVVKSEKSDRDEVLNPMGAVPAWVIQKRRDNATFFQNLEEAAAGFGVQFDIIAKETHLVPCNKDDHIHYSALRCLLAAAKMLDSYVGDENTEHFPTLVKAAKKLREFAWNATYVNPLNFSFLDNVGPVASPFAKALLEDIVSNVPYKGYTGDDSFLRSVCALGLWECNPTPGGDFINALGRVYVLEVYADSGVPKSKKARMVHLLEGFYNVTSKQYVMTDGKLRCNSQYGAWCTVEGIQKELNDVYNAKMCFWGEGTSACEPEEHISGLPSDSPCGLYRTLCPAQACGDSRLLSKDGNCVEPDSDEHQKRTATIWKIAVSGIAILAALISTLALLSCVCSKNKARRGDEYRYSATVM